MGPMQALSATQVKDSDFSARPLRTKHVVVARSAAHPCMRPLVTVSEKSTQPHRAIDTVAFPAWPVQAIPKDVMPLSRNPARQPTLIPACATLAAFCPRTLLVNACVPAPRDRPWASSDPAPSADDGTSSLWQSICGAASSVHIAHARRACNANGSAHWGNLVLARGAQSRPEESAAASVVRGSLWAPNRLNPGKSW
eukprot:CAMPEP_0185159164 /NCGR_PEP_ID=MMETSP1139-20130426/2872_1 /TAXON_ID=298111 /ORGANISM="Pavlova sp., Strain CCMP459" /LENGTH=196 /DNA_ID=CAMNT_0027724329 /DNA_START=344 /DNA_END=935 /DNA_ORIENTATION=-